MRHVIRFAAPSLAIALAACGGGGGGGPQPIQAPAPAPTPTPTPTPTPAQTNSTLVNLQFSQSFTSGGSALAATIAKPSGTSTGRTTTPSGGSITNIRYDAATQSYVINPGNNIQQTFGPANRVGNTTAAVTAYQRASGNVTENLALFTPGPTNPTLALTYASYGAYQRITDSSSSVDLRQHFFIWGIPTATADVPRTGSATYRTTVDGFWVDQAASYSLTGTSSFSADFASGRLDIGATLVGSNVVNGATRTLGSLAGNTTLGATSPAFSGSLSTVPAGFSSGTFGGMFFGPQAVEMGATFIMGGSSGIAQGAIVGAKN